MPLLSEDECAEDNDSRPPFTTSTYEPMVRQNIYFVGPFSNGGYILTIIDTFTRWVELYVCKSADAQEVARCFSNTLVDSEHPHRYSLIEVRTS